MDVCDYGVVYVVSSHMLYKYRWMFYQKRTKTGEERCVQQETIHICIHLIKGRYPELCLLPLILACQGWYWRFESSNKGLWDGGGWGGLKLHNVCIRIRTGWNSPILRLIVSVIIHIAICNTEINLAQNILWHEGFHVLFRLRSYEHHAEPGEYIMYRHVSFNTVEVRVK